MNAFDDLLLPQLLAPLSLPFYVSQPQNIDGCLVIPLWRLLLMVQDELQALLSVVERVLLSEVLRAVVVAAKRLVRGQILERAGVLAINDVLVDLDASVRAVIAKELTFNLVQVLLPMRLLCRN